MEDAYDPALAARDTDRFVVLTGCSGGGKSTLLAELARRGFPVFPEVGRQIVREQDWTGGDALPWTNPVKFAELAVSRALHFRILAVGLPGPVFFDRGPIDQLAALERLSLPTPAAVAGAAERLGWNPTVFVTPPWPEIFTGDAERRHGFEAAVEEYGPLVAAYERLGYEVVELPKVDVAARADVVLERLRPACGPPRCRKC
jgi:predicted ATPase